MDIPQFMSSFTPHQRQLVFQLLLKLYQDLSLNQEETNLPSQLEHLVCIKDEEDEEEIEEEKVRDLNTNNVFTLSSPFDIGIDWGERFADLMRRESPPILTSYSDSSTTSAIQWSNQIISSPATPAGSLPSSSYGSADTRSTNSSSIGDTDQDPLESHITSSFNMSSLNTPTRLQVGNFPQSWKECHLRNMFESFGRVLETEIINFRGFIGFGFVSMENRIDAEKAKKTLDGIIVDGREMIVDFSRPTGAFTNSCIW